MVTHGDRVLLVRHTYGDRDHWELPGGFRKRGEAAETAGGRELHEELGLHGAAWRDLGTRRSRTHQRRETVSYLQTEVHSDVLCVNRAELAEARWFARDDLPPDAATYIAPLLRRSGTAQAATTAT